MQSIIQKSISFVEMEQMQNNTVIQLLKKNSLLGISSISDGNTVMVTIKDNAHSFWCRNVPNMILEIRIIVRSK
jgi:hypothetical protein